MVWLHRRRMEREAKVKVVVSVWGADFVQFLAAQAILPISIWKNRMNSTAFFLQFDRGCYPPPLPTFYFDTCPGSFIDWFFLFYFKLTAVSLICIDLEHISWTSVGSFYFFFWRTENNVFWSHWTGGAKNLLVSHIDFTSHYYLPDFQKKIINHILRLFCRLYVSVSVFPCK